MRESETSEREREREREKERERERQRQRQLKRGAGDLWIELWRVERSRGYGSRDGQGVAERELRPREGEEGSYIWRGKEGGR